MLDLKKTFNDYVDAFNEDKSVRFIEPMSSKELSHQLLDDYETKCLLELKCDGHRGLLYIGDEINRVFSRRISKKTKWYNENTENVPHIANMKFKGYEGSVLDGEFAYGKNSMDAQTVMGSLPERAINHQEEHGYIEFYVFDILYYKGINVQKLPLWKRKVLLMDILAEHYAEGSEHIKTLEFHLVEPFCRNLIAQMKEYACSLANKKIAESMIECYTKPIESFKTVYKKFVSSGLEGVMIKDISGVYEQKTSNNYRKVKAQDTWDCIVMGFTEPTKEYTGKELAEWMYWEEENGVRLYGSYEELKDDYMGLQPVTKPYYNGWCGGITFGVWKEILDGEFTKIQLVKLKSNGQYLKKDGKEYHLFKVGDCKGISDELSQDIKENGRKMIEDKLVIEVLANQLINKEIGSLRHPRFLKFRKDKNHDVCTFDKHIRQYTE